MRKLIALTILSLTLVLATAQSPSLASPQQVCVTPSVTASPDPVAVGSSVMIDQTLTNSCNGQGNITFWTNVDSPCDGNDLTLEFIRNQKVPAGGSVTFSDSYTPLCAGTYTVTTTVQYGAQKFTSATTTFTAQ